MRFSSSSKGVIGSMLLASAVSSQFINTLPSCWQTCIKNRGPQCSSTDLDCACHFASTPNLLPILISCVRNQCTDTSLAGYLISPFGALQIACSQTQYTISDDDVASVSAAAANVKAGTVAGGAGGDTVTATGLTRAHKVVTTAAATSSAAETAAAAAASTTAVVLASSSSETIMTESESLAPVVVQSDTSTTSSTSSTSSSSSSKKPTSTSNGGTVLDQAGSSLGLRRDVASGIGALGLSSCFLVGCILL